MRIDFYTHPHKAQRKSLFSLATKIGEADFTNATMVNDIQQDLLSITNELREHAFNEETFVHPLLAKKIPSSERTLQNDHDHMKKYLTDLENMFSHVQSLTLPGHKIQAQGLEFYRMFNRFIVMYLTHINEEEYTMQNLWEIALDAELTGIMIAFQTYDGLEKGKQWLSTHLPAMNLDERFVMFNTTQLLIPAPIFAKMCELTKEVIGQEQWQQISTQLK